MFKSNTINDAVGFKALSSKEINALSNCPCKSALIKARKYINYNLEYSPNSTFWTFGNFDSATVDQIEKEYKEAGWEVIREKEVMNFRSK